jgi:hypothetical protein
MKYYATMGQSHTHRINGVTIDCNGLVEIEANNYEDAYEFCNQIFSRKWCSLYEEPHMEFYPRGIVLSLTAES